MALPITDTRSQFRSLCREIVDLLQTLAPDDWDRPTMAGTWRVRDVVAHLLDTALRRLSFHRDGASPPAPPHPLQDADDLIVYINHLNAMWVETARRMSPRVLTDFYREASGDLADFMESLPLEAPAFFAVSWAGEPRSAQWFDIGREFTEIWHHGAQVRDAVGAGPFRDAAWLSAVLAIAMRALPYAYRDVQNRDGRSLMIIVTGASGGTWTLGHDAGAWSLAMGGAADAAATVMMTDEVAWRLLFNALTPQKARALIRADGDATLAAPLLQARAVIV
jgi:uncharacterized protein (TIGR03083 family)